MLPFALGVLTSVSTYAGGWIAMRFASRQRLIFGITAGFVLGLALFELLPEALQDGAGVYPQTCILAALGAGFVFYLGVARLAASGLVGRGTLVLHSFQDGLAIGLAFRVSSAAGWLIAAAVIAHDMADGANMVGLSLATDDRRKAFKWLLANALAPLAGIAIGQFIALQRSDFALVLALFAGGFLYIGACELLPRSRDAGGGWRNGFACIIGLVVMAGIAQLMR